MCRDYVASFVVASRGQNDLEPSAMVGARYELLPLAPVKPIKGLVVANHQVQNLEPRVCHGRDQLTFRNTLTCYDHRLKKDRDRRGGWDFVAGSLHPSKERGHVAPPLLLLNHVVVGKVVVHGARFGVQPPNSLLDLGSPPVSPQRKKPLQNNPGIDTVVPASRKSSAIRPARGVGIAAGLNFQKPLIIFPYMPTALSQRLARARRVRGLTQAALGRTAGVPHAMMISGWERGVNLPRVDYLTAVARELGVSLDWLCGLTERGGPRQHTRARLNGVGP